MNRRSLAFILLAFLLTGCATMRPDKIRYNENKGLYEYPITNFNIITLRNEFHQVVDSSNYGPFREELSALKNRYPYKERIENSSSLKKDDYELALRYGKVNQLIHDGDYQRSIDQASQLLELSPGINKYSDVNFLKGYAFEKLGMEDSAKIMYGHFLKHSSQKLPAKFHGYRDFDVNDSMFIAERNHAKNYRLGENQTGKISFHPIKPKYYYGSIQPGYTLNPEDLSKKSRGLLMLLFGKDISDEFLRGFQYYYKVNDWLNINPRFAYSENMKEFSMAFPLQIFKSEDNRFGLKLTPFISHTSIDSITFNDKKYPADESFLNYGARISAGYYLAPHLALGAYYQYHYYNEENKYINYQTQIEVWMHNELDVSLYYNIHKGCSLKAGVKNSDLVAGFFWNCWEISYNITDPGLILRVDLY